MAKKNKYNLVECVHPECTHWGSKKPKYKGFCATHRPVFDPVPINTEKKKDHFDHVTNTYGEQAQFDCREKVFFSNKFNIADKKYGIER